MASLEGTREQTLGSRSRRMIWFLVGRCGVEDGLRQVPLHIFPFQIGRRADANLTLSNLTISSLHAELSLEGDKLVLRDLGSTNGTFVNGRRLRGETAVYQGDLVQFADIAFRVQQEDASCTSRTVSEDLGDQAFALVQFDRLMSEQNVCPHYQPIISLQVGHAILGYEVLARSQVMGLQTAQAMFRAAARLNQEAELSRMLRMKGVETSQQLLRPPHLFLNTHPRELGPGLVESLSELRSLYHTQPLTLEIHEGAVADVEQMTQLRTVLRALHINLAYDDYGAGQHRLRELFDVPPDYLKFDMSLIRDIDRASGERQRMLASMIQIASDLNVTTLAEGVETASEAETCRQLGFDLAQGYLFGKPLSIGKLREASE